MNLKPLIVATLALLPMISGVARSQADIAPPNEDAPWYQVNIVIFKQPGHLLQSETWKPGDELDLSLPANLLSLETPAEDNAPTEEAAPLAADADTASTTEPVADILPLAFVAIPSEDEEFVKTVNRLTRSPYYEILYQSSWLQPPLDEQTAIPVLIQAGEVYNGLYELEGTTKLHVSRYLHFETNLWLSKYIQQIEVLKPWWQESNDNQFTLQLNDSENQNDISLSPSFNQMGSTITMGETITRYKSIRTGVMNESRRMRSGELHYIDHPLFGLIVKVVPYIPEPEETTESDDLALATNQ